MFFFVLFVCYFLKQSFRKNVRSIINFDRIYYTFYSLHILWKEMRCLLFYKCFERLKQQFITFIRDLRVFTFLVERIFCARCSVGTLFLLRLFGPIPSTKWSEHTLEYLQHQNTQNGIIKYWKGRKKTIHISKRNMFSYEKQFETVIFSKNLCLWSKNGENIRLANHGVKCQQIWPY